VIDGWCVCNSIYEEKIVAEIGGLNMMSNRTGQIVLPWSPFMYNIWIQVHLQAPTNVQYNSIDDTKVAVFANVDGFLLKPSTWRTELSSSTWKCGLEILS
jgi:hypothetical protein